MSTLHVEALKVSGFLGRRQDKIDGNCLSITNGKIYLVTDGYINDDRGRTLKLNIKPYAKANRCDYYFSDHSASDGHADFKIVQERIK